MAPLVPFRLWQKRTARAREETSPMMSMATPLHLANLMLCGMCKVEAKNALENYAYSMRNTLRDEKVCCSMAQAHSCTFRHLRKWAGLCPAACIHIVNCTHAAHGAPCTAGT